MHDSYDLVIIGGGVSGCALATVMGRTGKSVLLLEQTESYSDIVRGEAIPQWGQKEAQTLDLYETLIAAGGHHMTRNINYDETISPEVAEAAAMDRAPGQLALGHPRHRQALFDAAVTAGVDAKRGVQINHIEFDSSPSVVFEVDGNSNTARTRLIVGADGRNSIVRQSAGVALEQDAPRNYFGGLLVEGAEGWDERVQTIGTHRDLNFFVFPQGQGKVRVYAAWPLSERQRFTGVGGVKSFLSAFRMPCCPKAEHIASATPAGPFRSFLNNESRAATLTGEGFLLVGDAAGWSDPILGQGLASAYRDVRIVADVLRSTDDWSPRAFELYESERRERSSRLAFVAELVIRLFADFDEQCRERRVRFFGKVASDPAVRAPFGALILGPDAIPAAAFTTERRAHILNG